MWASPDGALRPHTRRNAPRIADVRLCHLGPADQADLLATDEFWIFRDHLRGDRVRFVASLSARPWEQHDRPWLLLT